MCVVTLDFQNAFDRISHEYFFSTLRSYGLSDRLIMLIQSLYTDVTSAVLFNGDLHGQIPICYEVRQGCPLSMTLYNLCLQPFLNLLEQRLTGISIGRRHRPISVVAYADDVTIFVTSQTDLSVIEDAIRLFEKASGARLSARKSKALPTGRWNTNTNIIGIPYHPHVEILGVQFCNTIQQSAQATWTQLTGRVRTHTKEAYSGDLCLANRISYTQIYLLSKIWYVAQIFPPTKTHTQQITTAITFFIWKGATFRVPISTFQAPKSRGGWELIDVNSKCKALLYYRMYNQSKREKTTTAAWIQECELHAPIQNPLNMTINTRTPTYVRSYAMDMAYIPPPCNNETPRLFRKRIYRTLHAMVKATTQPRSLRVEIRYPNHNWPQIWRNLHIARIPEVILSVWYTVIHDIIPTKQRLLKIALTNTDRCVKCDQTDTLLHRMTDVAQGNKYGNGHRTVWQQCSKQAQNISLPNGHSGPILARDRYRDTEQFYS